MIKLKFVLICFLIILVNCTAKVNNIETKNKVDYGIAIVSYLQILETNEIFCENTSYNVKSQFKVEKFLKGDLTLLEQDIINYFSCEHWSKNPYQEIDGYVNLGDNYDYKRLVLFIKKDLGFYILEKELVFKLKNNELGICTHSNLLKDILRKENKAFGEYIGVPKSIKSVLDPDFYVNSECETVKNNFIYLDKGIRL